MKLSLCCTAHTWFLKEMKVGTCLITPLGNIFLPTPTVHNSDGKVHENDKNIKQKNNALFLDLHHGHDNSDLTIMNPQTAKSQHAIIIMKVNQLMVWSNRY